MSSSSLIRSLTALLLFCCLLTTACGTKLAKSLLELQRLQSAVAREFSEPNVNVNVGNTGYLTVTFINSSLNEGSPDDRARRAERVAAFVKTNYSGIEQVVEIWVNFSRQHTRYIFIHFSESVDYFGFDRNAQPIVYGDPITGADTGPARRQASAVYSAASNQTEVRVSSLQLSGNLTQGLAVACFFTVPGDATGVRRSAVVPKAVTLEFGSYSEKSLFPGEPKIVLLADGKVAFETKAQFSTSKNQQGSFSEFLVLEVPYPAFRRLTAGKHVTLRLGDFEFELTEEQLAALREMTEYIRA